MKRKYLYPIFPPEPPIFCKKTFVQTFNLFPEKIHLFSEDKDKCDGNAGCRQDGKDDKAWVNVKNDRERGSQSIFAINGPPKYENTDDIC